MVPRRKTEFRFSICSPWLSLTLLLIFGTWLLKGVTNQSESEPGSTLEENAFSGARLSAQKAGRGCPAPQWVWNEVHANVAPLPTTFAR